MYHIEIQCSETTVDVELDCDTDKVLELVEYWMRLGEVYSITIRPIDENG